MITTCTGNNISWYIILFIELVSAANRLTEAPHRGRISSSYTIILDEDRCIIFVIGLPIQAADPAVSPYFALGHFIKTI